MYEFETSPEILEILDNSAEKEKFTELLSFVWKECKEKQFQIEDYKWKSLVNHMAAMRERARKGEVLEEIDPEMFSEIGEDSLTLAKEIVNRIENLQENEMYLLSVHFEAAK